MNSRQLVLSRRIRKTPFEERVFENGAKSFTTYNHMPLASVYESVEEDYQHLIEHVQIWDVACERQVEVCGPDALKLVELITPRDISKCQIGQCMYAPLVDEFGKIVNDPIIIKLNDDRYWISIADSGVLLWVKGIAFGRNLDVKVFEPDVSPLAIQGPKAYDLLEDLVGPKSRELKYFWFIQANIAGTNAIVAKSGWSGQLGFEVYLQDFSKGLVLWDEIQAVGQKYNIRAGCPNLIDRIEKGLLSYGSDMTINNNPYECGLDRFFELGKKAEYMSSIALKNILEDGVQRNLVYLFIEGSPLVSPRSTWDVLDDDKNSVGIVTSSVYSTKHKYNIAFATVNAEINQFGKNLLIDTGNGNMRFANVTNRSWELAGEIHPHRDTAFV